MTRRREIMPKTKLGFALRLARHRTGKTVQKLALDLGISRGRLSEYETGRKRPDSRSLARLLVELPTGYHGSIRIAALEDELAALRRRVVVVRALLRSEFPVQAIRGASR